MAGGEQHAGHGVDGLRALVPERGERRADGGPREFEEAVAHAPLRQALGDHLGKVLELRHRVDVAAAVAAEKHRRLAHVPPPFRPLTALRALSIVGRCSSSPRPTGPSARRCRSFFLAALALDALVGDPRWLPHPVRAMGWLTGLLDRALNRERWGEGARALLGVVAVAAVTGASAAAGWAVAHYVAALAWGWLAELALVAMLLAQRTMCDHMVRVARALDIGAEPARAELRHIVGRDVSALDEHGIARAAIESGAENYSDGVVAPAFWYLLLGLPGLLAYKAINTMDSMIGHRSPRHHAFGRAAARLDDAVNWVPARIAGGLIAVAAVFLPGAAPGRALRTMVRDAPKHSSPNAGWPEAAMAGALGLALLGPRRYEGEAAADAAWLGSGRAEATADDLRRTVWVFAVACVLVAAVTAAIAAGTALGGA